MELNEIHNPNEHASVSLKVILLVFAVALIGVLGYLVWDAQNTPETADYNPQPVVEKKSANTELETQNKGNTNVDNDNSETWRTYTNSTYGFSLKFGDLWKGYEVKTDKTDALATYYFNVPSPHKTTETTLSSANFESIFAVSVYTSEEWKKLEPDGGPIGTKFGTNGNYVFVYSSSQDWSEELQAAHDDIKNVVATFAIVQ